MEAKKSEFYSFLRRILADDGWLELKNETEEVKPSRLRRLLT